VNKRILAAMSGGVDSSVAALLLIQQGYSVDGGTMTLFSKEDILISSGACGSSNEANDARRICDRLGIGHHLFCFHNEFRQDVIGHFAKSYLNGETPNPCVECNRCLKFRRFFDKAVELGYDGMATGHYARVEYDSGSGRYLLKKAADVTKDQTYFLYSLPQDVLSHTLLPLGGMTKAQIREIAADNGFINADKPDSQDICFIPGGDYAAFLEEKLGCRCPEGEFFREDTQTVVGRHKGFHRYTIGQRKGLGIAAEKPLYVIRKDHATNRVILGDNNDLFTDSLTAVNCNWIALDRLTSSIRVAAKTRYSQSEAVATVCPISDSVAEVTFDTPQRAVTAGQAGVFYDGDTVVGGGTISTKGE